MYTQYESSVQQSVERAPHHITERLTQTEFFLKGLKLRTPVKFEERAIPVYVLLVSTSTRCRGNEFIGRGRSSRRRRCRRHERTEKR